MSRQMSTGNGTVPTAEQVKALRTTYWLAHRHQISLCWQPDSDAYHEARNADADAFDAWLAASDALKASTV
jgi:hypothetical protein